MSWFGVLGKFGFLAVEAGRIMGSALVAYLAFVRPELIRLQEPASDTPDKAKGLLALLRKTTEATIGRLSLAITAIALLISLISCFLCSTYRNCPLFTVTLPDSQHWVSKVGSRSGTGPWANRITVVKPDIFRSHGMAPKATLKFWSRWLVVRVLEHVDSATPRYYFLDQETRRIVVPWSPGEKVYLETFDPEGRFVVFTRDSFLSSRSITRRVHHFDPATKQATKFSRPKTLC